MKIKKFDEKIRYLTNKVSISG